MSGTFTREVAVGPKCLQVSVTGGAAGSSVLRGKLGLGRAEQHVWVSRAQCLAGAGYR